MKPAKNETKHDKKNEKRKRVEVKEKWKGGNSQETLAQQKNGLKETRTSKRSNFQKKDDALVTKNEVLERRIKK